MSYTDAKKVVYLQSIYKELESLVKEIGTVEGTSTTWNSITGDQTSVNLSGFTNDAGFITSESDPTFATSPAASITQPNIATWNSSLQPGANVSTLTNDAGYITSETDPVFIASPASGITSGNITNWNSAVQPTDLATVATTGVYTDLTGIPTLGTAASSDIGDFATAAQGTLAGTATQPGDNVSTLTNDSGYITGTTGFSGSFVTATDTITVVNGLITAVTPL